MTTSANVDHNRKGGITQHHHGLTLIPPPSGDPKDPLRWPRWLKQVALAVTAMVNFTANFAGAGLSVAVILLEMEFRKTAGQVNALLTVRVPCAHVRRLADASSDISSTSSPWDSATSSGSH